MRIAIIRTGVANLASVQAAFKRLQLETYIAELPSQIEKSDAVVLPGVGAFGAGIDALTNGGWIDFVQDRYKNDTPTLAICLGMQMLCDTSEETPGINGVSIFKCNAQRFPADVRIPQFGWNKVFSTTENWQGGYVYFANSFCLTEIEALRKDGWEILTAKHGIEFVAAARKGNWLTCQFHPELSGTYGLDLIRSWLSRFTTIGQDPVVEGSVSC